MLIYASMRQAHQAVAATYTVIEQIVESAIFGAIRQTTPDISKPDHRGDNS